uniref:Uncharacterized protein n=1 Tax=uncultured Alphaproteobacteria bacterium TaxID=91750 RepID=A0A6G8F450_9PROT|nr:hypothetical protein PlAlph_6830 [uncultured Alphaproteobacteria bacterium]
MANKLLSSVALFTAVLTAPAIYATEVPQALTIDRLSAETSTFLNNSQNINIHSLSTVKSAETDVSVNIDGTIYYFAPKGTENQNTLQTLADIGSAALVKLDSADGAIYSLEKNGTTVYYGYDVAKLPESGYSLELISKDEADKLKEEAEEKSEQALMITKYAKNADNTLSESYYKVDIKQPESGRKVYTDRRTALRGDIDADFIGSEYVNSKIAYGGAIYNSSSTIGNITGNFINNYAQSTSSIASGGAIYNYRSTIGNITGDFINNYAYAQATSSEALGGAIYNASSSTIGNITSDFIIITLTLKRHHPKL